MRGWGVTAITETGVAKLVDQYAKDGKLNFDDFCEIMEKRMSDAGLTEDVVLDSFAVLDKEKNGKVKATDLKHMLCKMGDHMEPKQVDELIKDFGSPDSDGYIDYKAFINSLNENFDIFT
jgi:calcium-binding protein CML